jgi:hypothetical protein
MPIFDLIVKKIEKIGSDQTIFDIFRGFLSDQREKSSETTVFKLLKH